MRTRRALYALALLLAGTALAPAFDRSDLNRAPVAKPVPQAHAESIAETRRALGAYRDGRKVEAADIFAAAAARGHLPAQWKLARMLATGDGVEVDPVRATALFAAIADRYAHRDPALRDVPFVADATREAGRMQLAGHGGPRDVRAARRHLWRAATTYRDAEARYLLGLSMLDEAHGRIQPEVAYGWLRSAVALGHPAAAVRMGEMQVAGLGTKANAMAGLLLMARGVERAKAADRPSLALRFQAVRADMDEAVQTGIDAELARLDLGAAMQPVMTAAE